MNELLVDGFNLTKFFTLTFLLIIFLPALLVLTFKFGLLFVKMTTSILIGLIIFVPTGYVVHKIYTVEKKNRIEVKTEKEIPKAIIVNE